TRAELKNINSFRFIKQAVEYEIVRQVELIEGGGKVVQETRLYDSQRGETRSMRSKEEAHDYRYFPEPDLPPLLVAQSFIDDQQKKLPELPRAKLSRFQSQFGLPAYDGGILVADRHLAEYFEAVAAHVRDYKKLSNWFLGELARLMNESKATVASLKFTPAQFGELLETVEKGTISNNAAKDVFGVMFATGRAPAEIIQEKGLAQVQDVGAIEKIVDEVLAKAPGEIEKYKAGQKKLFSFFVGQVMKAMKGKGNPQLVNELLKKKIGE
ncbi:MAG: Asp-tRNA(Asn)/Glu-tRNA(Gln) amidotransferase subunit GatB, partial [Myxococcaceae bacterium]